MDLSPCFAFLLSCVLILCIIGLRKYPKRENIPGPSVWELLTVHARKALGDELLTHLWHTCENYNYQPWAVWYLGDTFTVLSDCDSISALYKSKNFFDKPSFVYSGLIKYAGRGLLNLTVNDAEYKRHRKIILPAYRKTVVESYLPMINEEATKLVHHLRGIADGRSAVMSCFVEDVVLEISIGTFSVNAYTNRDSRKICQVISSALSTVHHEAVNPFYWLIQWWQKLTGRSGVGFEILDDEMRRACKVAKEDAVKQKNDTIDWRPSNVSEIILFGSSETEGCLTDEEYFAETKNMVAAGTETTAFVLNMCLILLALHPDVQERVYQEMISIFGQSCRPVDPGDLSAMTYTDLVLKETLRLYPSVPIFMRQVAEDTDLSGSVVKKGSIVAVNIFALHRNPKYFKDPLRFDPSRFLPEYSGGRHPIAYIPFSYGYRSCPGQLQPPVLIKCIVSHIVRNFKILPGEGLNCMDDIKVKHEVSMHLCKLLQVRLNKRRSDE